MPDLSLRCTAFADARRIASGELRHVALKARQAFANGRRVLPACSKICCSWGFERASNSPT